MNEEEHGIMTEGDTYKKDYQNFMNLIDTFSIKP